MIDIIVANKIELLLATLFGKKITTTDSDGKIRVTLHQRYFRNKLYVIKEDIS